MAGEHRVNHHRHRAALRLRFLLLPLAVLAAGALLIGAAGYVRVRADLRTAASFAHGGESSTWEIVRPGVVAATAAAAVVTLAAVLATLAAIFHAVAASARAVAAQARARAVDSRQTVGPAPHLREFRHLAWMLDDGLRHHDARLAALRGRVSLLREQVAAARRELGGGERPLEPSRLRSLHRAAHAVEEGWRAFRLPPAP